MVECESGALLNFVQTAICIIMIFLLLGLTPDCQGEKMYDRVVHMHESCEYDIVGERTGETFKTARVLKASYKRVKENKICQIKKQNKKHFRPPFPSRLHIKFGFDWPSGFRGEDV